MKRLLCCSVIGVCALCAFADTLYVDINDPNAGDDACEGRGSEALPYASIQAAVNAAQEDWTIKVNPGAYTNNGRKGGSSWSTAMNNRVFLDKRLTLVSRQGKDVTHIVGEKSTDSTYGLGVGATRGLFVDMGGSGSRIEGFTFRDGGTDSNSRVKAGGGGWRVELGADAYFVDCVVSNCAGYAVGGIMGGTAIRCLIKNNKTDAWNIPSAARWANLWNCVVFQHQIGNTAIPTMIQTTNVNVTVIYAYEGTSYPDCGLWGCDFRNSVSVTSGNDVFIADTYTEYNCENSVTTTENGNFQLFASLLGDWRLLPTSAAVGAANVAHLTGTFPLPADVVADMRDYAGNAIDTTQPLNAGAIQTVGEVTCGKFQMDKGLQFYVDGVFVPMNYTWQPPAYPTFYNIKPYNYSQFPGYPQAVHFEYIEGGMSIVRCQDTNGVFTVCGSPDASKTSKMFYLRASQAVWVSQLRGSDDGSADGTSEHPFASLQYAVENSVLGTADNKSVVMMVERGDYATGGVTAHGLMSRVAVTRTGNEVRMIAVDGPERTVIRGGADTRCADGIRIIQGFTLTGANIADNSANGAAAYNCSLVDCIVSNNVGGASLHYMGLGNNKGFSAVRTRYIGNTVDGDLLDGYSGEYCAFAHCLVAGNAIDGNVFNGDHGTPVFNCTVADNTVGSAIVSGTPRLYNSIFCDSPSIAVNSYSGGIVINRILSHDALPASWTDEPVKFVDRASFDYRLLPESSAIGQGYADPRQFDGGSRPYGQYYYMWLDRDLSRNLPEFSDGRTYAGCYQSAKGVVNLLRGLRLIFR